MTVLAAFGGGIAMPAYAQDTAGQADETRPEAEADQGSNQEIVVTGSLFRRTDTETPSPVTVLSAETLEQRGLNTVAEAVQRVSAGNAGTITQGWNTGFNFATGANAVSLRGLTVQSTLTIFDGLRMAPYPLADDGQRNFVDLNTIPNAIIDRIDVLRDGASSTYGADAVAGVVNVITKKEVQGLHLNGSAGISQRGDAGEQRMDATYGYGSLADQGFNFYISGEYQRQDELWARDRGSPFNTSDRSSICNGSGACLGNGIWNGVSPDGTFNGLISIPGIALVRPVDDNPANTPDVPPNPNVGAGRYQYLNPAAGCGRWPTTTITPAQSGTSPLTVCEVDINEAYRQLMPQIQRFGFSGRFTVNVGEDHQLYMQGNYYQTDTLALTTPGGFNGTPVPPNGGIGAYNVMLPVYVCPTGVGTRNGTGTGCTADNGVLNPYNPFAAQGRTAQMFFRSPRAAEIETSSRSLRGIIGLSGSFLDDWNYSVDFTASNVQLDRIDRNAYIPQRIADIVARGQFNFLDPEATPQSVWDYISPESRVRSNSDLWQATATVGRSLFDLPGGPLQVAAGLAYRHESINAPSANPGVDPVTGNQYDRYYNLNAVGTAGSRNVFSAFGEIDAPIVDQLELNLSGRYDEYSTGQSNFSPKVGVKFTPIPQLALRGTWSKGFRIPSFNEAFGLPTTGYVSAGGGNFCATYAAFCAAHGNNAYATESFNLGITSIGNPELDPERSESMTVGFVFEPIRNVSFTVDLWRIKVKDLIVSVTDSGPAIDAYYRNNGVVNIPGLNVIAGTPDQAFPNALPHIGFIETSFTNASSQLVQGIDFGVNARFNVTDAIQLISSFEASYLDKNHLTPIDPFTGDAGDVQEYEGTLSPCNTTSCSGSPRWRASWQNTLDFGNTTVSVTAYYTSGYDFAEVDLGMEEGECEGATTWDDGEPYDCRSKAIWNVDLTASHKINDDFTIYANILNVLDIEPPFDPNAAYGIFGYNPAWGGPNIMGRYFRVGAKVGF